MKVSVSYPPIPTDKGTPLLSQNRQFQYFNEPTYIYPMVPASAATMLKVAGHEAIWDDAIAEQKPYDSWLKEVAHESPELIAIEAKAPVIKRYWKTISDIKEDFRFPGHLWLDAAHHELAPAQASAQTRLVQFRFCFGEADPLVTVVRYPLPKTPFHLEEFR